MSRSGTYQGMYVARFPRVSGDEPYGQETTVGIGAFSPRERG